MKPESSLHYSFYVPVKLILSKVNQGRYYFTEVIGTRITFVSCIGQLTYEHYIKKPIPMVGINLNQILSRNPNLISDLNRTICHPILRNYINIPFN